MVLSRFGTINNVRMAGARATHAPPAVRQAPRTARGCVVSTSPVAWQREFVAPATTVDARLRRLARAGRVRGAGPVRADAPQRLGAVFAPRHAVQRGGLVSLRVPHAGGVR